MPFCSDLGPLVNIGAQFGQVGLDHEILLLLATVTSKGWVANMHIGVLFGCFSIQIDGPGLPVGLIMYQGHLFPLKGHL